MEPSTQPITSSTGLPETLGVSALGASNNLSNPIGAGTAAVSSFSSTATPDAEGLMLPVQALTTAFVYAPQSEPIAAPSATAPAAAVDAATPKTATEANPPADPNAAMAQMLADSLPQTPAELQALSGAALDAEFIVGAAQRQGFMLGDVGVMVSYEDGSELTDVPQLYYLPNSPAWFLGMANLHGNMVPVFDLAAYLGVEQNETETPNKKQNIDNKRMLLVLAHGADAAGVVVHGIPQRLYVMQEQAMAPDVAPNLLLPHVSNAYFMDNHVWFDLEVDSLLAALEGAMQTM